MNIFAPLTTALVPLALFVFPGLGLVVSDSRQSILAQVARAMLWSLVILTFGSIITVALGLPLSMMATGAGVVTFGTIWYKRAHFFKLTTVFSLFLVTSTFFVLYLIFSLPFLLFHDGLPTGDSQKSILWAQQILNNNSLPDYALSGSLLNRDPVDFYTPGLHALTALAMEISPHPLTTIGFLSIAMALGAAWIAAAIARELFPQSISFKVASLAALFVLTNFRFLRYIREPGYHYQNITGELLLFGFLLVALLLIRTWRWSDATLAVFLLITLALSHQFSAFLAAFVAAVVGVVLIIGKRSELGALWQRHKATVSLLSGLLLILIAVGFGIGLHHKIPDIFTLSPHLLPLTPNLLDYPQTMGSIWFISALAGLVLIVWQLLQTGTGKKVNYESGHFVTKKSITFRHKSSLITFAATTVVLLLLSQGPRLGIDIPPVRTLFYSIVPLSITGAYFFARLYQVTLRRKQWFGWIVVSIAIITSAGASVAKAFDLSHTVRTNSTLTGEQLTLIEHLKTSDPSASGVLIDDYNRRSASWLILSGRPMTARIAADLKRQMEEAVQSSVRYNLYLKQLDYEKIFALGSLPEITELMVKHNINWLAAVESSSDTSFRYNPALAEVARADDIILYKASPAARPRGIPTSPIGFAGRGREALLPEESAPPTALSKLPSIPVASHRELRAGNKTSEPPAFSSDSISTWLLRPTTLANDIGDREDTFEHLPAALLSTRISEPLRNINQTQTYRSTTAPYIPLHFNVGDYVDILWDKEHTGYPDTPAELLVRFTSPPANLTITTPTGSLYPLPADGRPVYLQSKDLPFDNKGFITLMINNPSGKPVNIDLIALGLARTL